MLWTYGTYMYQTMTNFTTNFSYSYDEYIASKKNCVVRHILARKKLHVKFDINLGGVSFICHFYKKDEISFHLLSLPLSFFCFISKKIYFVC
jgi:hypothetical protein